MKVTQLFVYVMCALGGGFVSAQERSPAFEVVSVRRNTSSGPAIGTIEGNTYRSTATTVYLLIQQAYGLPEYKLRGGPAWIQNDRFDITAKASTENGDVSRAQMLLMVRTLLEHRFGLVLTAEQRDGDVYVLKAARDDGRLGPDMHRVPDDCADQPKDYLGLARIAPRPSNGERPSFFGFCASMASVAGALGGILQATVTDQTGIIGHWNYVVSHSHAQSPRGDTRPELFTAIQDQLGLKLERKRGFNEVWVITSVRQPTEN